MGESIQDWKNSFDSLEDIMIIINKDYTIEKINKKGLELLGKKEKDVVGCKCYEIIHNVDGPGDYCPFKKTLESKKVESTERYEKVFDKYFSIKSSPIFNPKGEIVKFVDLMRDITERKKVEKRNRFFAAIVESSNDAIIGKSLDGTINSWNAAAEQIYGYAEREIIGKNISILFPKKKKNEISQIFNRIRKGEKINHFETIRKTKQGVNKFVSLAISPIKDENGEVIGASTIARDISKNKEIEKNLRQSEERYHSIFETTGTATSIFGDNRVIIRCNNAFERLSGYSKKEIEKKMSWDDFIPDPDRKRMMKYHKQRSKGTGNPPNEYDCNFINKKGELKTVHVKISVMPYNKERVFSLLDISDRKKNEEKIKKSLKEKETLLKEVHHRVKNNLQIVSTMLKLQSDFIDDENLLDKFKESQNRIQSIALVHERLYKSEDLSKINFDDYLRDFMVDIVHSYKDKKKSIDWRCNCKNISLNVSTGITCALIINELVSNSFKHAFSEKNQGRIDIELYYEHGGQYILKVKDDGKGLPKNFDIKRCSSLGLQLVDNLVNQFNGIIKYYNDNGAVFEIVFKEIS